MRVFAGPNGSGKSTIIGLVRDYLVNDHPIDFGIYVNADEIAVALRDGNFSFATYEVETTGAEFKNISLDSGLLEAPFGPAEFAGSYYFHQNRIRLRDSAADARIAQIIAHFLRKKLLMERKKFSFETVFSHRSKLDIMREAQRAGYKVYLYFVSTEAPEINIDRVANRRETGGHDVPVAKIRSRYYRSLDLFHEAAQIAYQAYFFDNTRKQPELIAHFKLQRDKKKWDKMDKEKLPEWFKQYYLSKVK